MKFGNDRRLDQGCSNSVRLGRPTAEAAVKVKTVSSKTNNFLKDFLQDSAASLIVNVNQYNTRGSNPETPTPAAFTKIDLS